MSYLFIAIFKYEGSNTKNEQYVTKFIDMLNLAIKRECLFKCWSYLIILDWSVNTQSAHH